MSQQEKPPRFVASPVDYDAWRQGYTPPTDHILIDALMFREAKVKFMTGFSPKHNMYVVVQGPEMTATQREQMRRVFKMMMDLMEPADGETPITPEAASAESADQARGESDTPPQPEGGADGQHSGEADPDVKASVPVSTASKPAAA